MLAGATVFYIILMFVVGYICSKRVNTADDYYVGARSLGPWVIGLSYMSTWSSSNVFITSPGFVYFAGAAYAPIPLFVAAWLGFFVVHIWIAPKVYDIANDYGVLTFQELFSVKLAPNNKKGSNIVRATSSIIYVISGMFYLGAIFAGTSTVMQSMFGLSHETAIILIGLIVTAYVVSGGFYAVVWTDFIQGWIMLAGLVLLIPVLYNNVGGFATAIETLKGIDPKLIYGGIHPWALTITTAAVVGIGTIGQPHIVNRFLGLKKKSDIGKMLIISLVTANFIQVTTYQMALAGRAIWPTEYLDKADKLIPDLVKYISGDMQIIGILFLLAVIAASMSSADSIGLSLGSTANNDLYEVFTKKKFDDKQSVRNVRIFTAIACLGGVVLSIKPPPFGYILTALAFGITAASFVVPLLFTLHWSKCTWQGCTASMIGGFVTMFVWHVAKIGIVHAFFPGIIMSLILMLVVSYATYKPAVLKNE